MKDADLVKGKVRCIRKCFENVKFLFLLSVHGNFLRVKSVSSSPSFIDVVNI